MRRDPYAYEFIKKPPSTMPAVPLIGPTHVGASPSTPPEETDPVDRLSEKTNRMFDGKNYPAAIKGYTAIINALEKAQKHSPLLDGESENSVMDMAESDDRLGPAYYRRGASFHYLTKLPQALADYRRAIPYFPTDSEDAKNLRKMIDALEPIIGGKSTRAKPYGP